MDSYLLPRHVHLCITAEAAVFLDLTKNKYLGLDASCIQAVQRLIDCPDANDENVRQLAEKLVANGLMTTDREVGRQPRLASLTPASATLIAFEHDLADTQPRCGTQHVFAFVVSLTIARTLWKLFPLRRAVERAAARKARELAAGNAGDLDKARELVSIFQQIRPFFYAAQSQCLIDTMTLIEFLARYGVHPEWVFGVKTRPFEAHTWAQHRGFVFNDLPSRTNTYTPILVV